MLEWLFLWVVHVNGEMNVKLLLHLCEMNEKN
jgi:hypothetical protein